MSDERRDRTADRSPGEHPVRPGALSELLARLARTDELGQPSRPVPRPGERVGRFEVTAELGRGGFGVVLEAHDPELGRAVALKLLRPGRHGVRDDAALLREAEAIARLSHQNIVTLFDVGTSPFGAYLVLELVRGETLEERLRRGPLPLADALRVADGVARGLAHAHASGVAHLDLKPSNVLLGSASTVKILDFGLARILGRAAEIEGGTPETMAPEQWRGEPCGPPADVFALGVILFRMLAGEAPFRIEDGVSTVLAPGPAPQLPAGVASRALRALVAACLERNPARRPSTGAAVLERLVAVRRALDLRLRLRLVRRASVAVAVVVLVAGTVLWRDRPDLGEAPVTVVLADFENATGDHELDALSGLLATSLEQSRRLSILTRAAVLDVVRDLGRDPASRIDEALGREVGRRSNARVLLLGAIHRFEATYALDLKGIDPARDRYLFTVTEKGRGKESIPDLLDRVSDRARAALAEDDEDVRSSRVRVGTAVTASLDAYQHYFRGEELATQARVTDALAEIRQSVEIDPSFALGHLSLAMLLVDYDLEASRSALAQARRYADRVPEKERLLIQALAAQMEFRAEEAMTYYEQVQRRWPNDADGWAAAARTLSLWRPGDPRIPAFLERAAALDPGKTANVVRAHVVAGRMEEALRDARRFAERYRTHESLRLLTAVQAVRGEEAAALATARDAVASGAAITDEILHAYVRGGAFAEAERVVRSAMREDVPAIERRQAYVSLAVLLAAQGRQRAALRVLEDAHREVDGGEGSLPLRWSRAFLLAGSGDPARIREIAESQRKLGEAWFVCEAALVAYLGDANGADQLLAGLDRDVGATPCAAMSRAVVAWRRGDPEGAISALQRIQMGMDRFFLGAILLASGRSQEALDQIRSFQNRMIRWMPFFGWSYPESLYLAALAHEQLGNQDAARRDLERLLASFRTADPDHPTLRRARALAARLPARPVTR